MKTEDIKTTLEQHALWLAGKDGGTYADLRCANLRCANLRCANLRCANLSDADLSDADLRCANLSGADLSDADLSGADLRCANLSDADLSDANLSDADLSDANLSDANLSDADLRCANLSGADLRCANLSGANIDSGIDWATNSGLIKARLSIVPSTGEFTGYKKVLTDTGTAIVTLRIPADSPRSNANGRKCRAKFVVVIDGEGTSSYDKNAKYAPGLRVECDKWCEDRWQECAGGIHFFITREEAEAYIL